MEKIAAEVKSQIPTTEVINGKLNLQVINVEAVDGICKIDALDGNGRLFEMAIYTKEKSGETWIHSPEKLEQVNSELAQYGVTFDTVEGLMNKTIHVFADVLKGKAYLFEMVKYFKLDSMEKSDISPATVHTNSITDYIVETNCDKVVLDHNGKKFGLSMFKRRCVNKCWYDCANTYFRGVSQTVLLFGTPTPEITPESKLVYQIIPTKPYRGKPGGNPKLVALKTVGFDTTAIDTFLLASGIELDADGRPAKPQDFHVGMLLKFLTANGHNEVADSFKGV